MRVLLSGNEAVARGCYEHGVKVATAYPGTPSTEILENVVNYKDDIYCQWSPNEKVAFEVAMGASFGGVRTLVAMKHVGHRKRMRSQATADRQRPSGRSPSFAWRRRRSALPAASL